MANTRLIQRLLSNFKRGSALQRAPVSVGTQGPPNPLPPLSHGYVHEPFSGAWQQNVWCAAPGDPGNFSAVFACVQIISTDVAKLQPIVYWRKPDGSKERFPNHPAQRVLNHPNEFQTRVDFFQQMMAALLLVGPSFTYLQRDQRNVVSGMYPLNPHRTKPVLANDGSLWFEVGYETLAPYSYEEIWKGRTMIPGRDVMYHRELTSPEYPLGAVSPIRAALTAATTGSTIQSHQQSFFENMSRASGVLTAPHKISKETADRLRVEWEQNFKAGSMGRVAVLGEGLTWQALALNAVDAQLIESLKWTVADVARCYRVPDYMLGIAGGGASTSKSAEQMTRNYYTQNLSYHLEALEVRLAEAFELAPDVFIEFDMSGLLRADFDVRMSAYKNAVNSGVYAINELRRMEELPPMEGGDQPLVQVQYTQLSTLVEKPRTAPTATVPPAQTGQPAQPPRPPPPPPPPARELPTDEELIASLGEAYGEMLKQRARQQLRAGCETNR